MKRLIAMMIISMSACGGLQNVAGPTYPTTDTDPTGKPLRDGYEYCQRISGSARVRASHTAVSGWTVSILGAGASLGGALIPISKTGTLTFADKFGSGAMIAGGGLLIALGQAILNRSDAASKLAGATASVLGEDVQGTDDRKDVIAATDAGMKCSIALGAWESSRSDATAIASKLLEAEKKEGSVAKARVIVAQEKATAADAENKQLKAATEGAKSVFDRIRACTPNCSKEEQQQHLNDLKRNQLIP